MSACAMTWEGSDGGYAAERRVRPRARAPQKIDAFGLDLMGRMMSWAAGIALVLVTLWILMVGYRVVTGTLREPLMAVVTQMTRIGLIVAVATSMAIFGSSLQTFLGTSLPTEINQLIAGSDSTPQNQIDSNLAKMQLALAVIDAVQVPNGDTQDADAKSRVALIAGLGAAGPAMTAGAMLLLFQFAMALFVGLGPLFILCLIFEPTKPLFQRWLLYGIGTMFALAMLSFVCTLALDITERVAVALFATNTISTWTGLTAPGLSSEAMQQGGLGLLMTVLIISTPPMAAMFFQGTLGQFYSFSQFQPNNGRSGLGPNGQPPGGYASGGGYLPPAQASAGQLTSQMGNQTGSFNTPAQVMPRNLGYATPQDIVRPANAPAPNPHLPPSPG